MNNPKKCPWCGGEAELSTSTFKTPVVVLEVGAARDFAECGPTWTRTYPYYFYCRAFCVVGPVTKAFDTVEEALAAWNTRAPLQMKPWNWRHEGPPVGYWKKPDLVEPTYKARINSDDAGHWAKVGKELMTRTIMYANGPAHGYTYFETEADAQAACVAFVEAKGREWFE